MDQLKELQKQVSDYDNRFGWDEDKAAHIVLHLCEELGEISRRILRLDGYKKEEFIQEELAQEITDLLYLTLKLANKFDINLDPEWQKMWKRYKTKTSRL